MNRVKLIRDFASQVAGEHVIIPRQRDVWSMGMSDSKPRLILPLDLDAKDDGDDRIYEYLCCSFSCQRKIFSCCRPCLHLVTPSVSSHDVRPTENHSFSVR